MTRTTADTLSVLTLDPDIVDEVIFPEEFDRHHREEMSDKSQYTGNETIGTYSREDSRRLLSEYINGGKNSILI